MGTHTRFPEGERPIIEVVWENIERYRQENKINHSELCRKVGITTSVYFQGKAELRNVRSDIIQR